MLACTACMHTVPEAFKLHTTKPTWESAATSAALSKRCGNKQSAALLPHEHLEGSLCTREQKQTPMNHVWEAVSAPQD